MANILNYYSYGLMGASLGDHLISICFGKLQECVVYGLFTDILNI